MDIQALFSRPLEEPFTEQEKEYILNYLKKRKYEHMAYYAIYNKPSSKGKYVTFILDFMANSTRRSSVMNNWTIISKRPLCELEYQEMASNFGTAIQRFKVWYYSSVEQLQQDDLQYGLNTPQLFVDKCKQLGYSKNIQLKLFNNF
jgi:hypothetical protein